MTTPGLYADLVFPEATAARPYIAINMIATIDGKTISGERSENVMDLGSSTDHATMRNLERAAGAVLIGAETLRATSGLHYAPDLVRLIATRSGNLPWEHRFFSDSGRVMVLCPQRAALPLELTADWVDCTDWAECLAQLRSAYGIRHLLVEGGSELNGVLLSQSHVDELFLTIAPKIKLGRGVPTYAGGDPLDRQHLLDFELISCQTVESEVFLRYRRSEFG